MRTSREPEQVKTGDAWGMNMARESSTEIQVGADVNARYSGGV